MHSIDCPSCGYQLEYEAKHVGKKGRCQKCKHLFVLPSISQETEQPEAELPLRQESQTPLFPDHPEIKELVPILCEHCSESYRVHNAMGISMKCDKCQKTTCVTLLDVSQLPGSHGGGTPGCVPGFQGDPKHYYATFQAASRAKARRQQLLNEGVLPSLLLSKMLDEYFGIPGEFPEGLKLAGANLSGALFFFIFKTLEHADLRGATLDGASWVSSSLKNARLDDASLKNCTIGGHSELSGASFKNADLSGSRISFSDYSTVEKPVDFTGANLEGATLEVLTSFSDGMFILKKAKMKGCKVPKRLAPMMSARQQAEAEILPSPEEIAAEERRIAAEPDRRFRSVPILAKKSQTHKIGESASVTASETTYQMSDVQEHVLKSHLIRHLQSWIWPGIALAMGLLTLIITGCGYAWFRWEWSWILWYPPVSLLIGAAGGFAALVASRQLYQQQARQDRGWKAGDNHPPLHIVFEHEWAQFAKNLR